MFFNRKLKNSKFRNFKLQKVQNAMKKCIEFKKNTENAKYKKYRVIKSKIKTILMTKNTK